MTTQPLIEKTSVDINLSGGIDESTAEQSVDWTRRLVSAVNVKTEGNSLSVRSGLGLYWDQPKDDQNDGKLEIVRAGNTGYGPIAIGRLGEFYKSTHNQNERMSESGTCPPFAVTKQAIYKQAGNFSLVKGMVAFPSINAIVTSDNRLIISDSLSGVQIAKYLFSGSSISICGVGLKYIHIFRTGTAGHAPGIVVFDITDLPDDDSLGFDSSALGWTTITSTAINDSLAGIASIDGGTTGLGYSVVAVNDAATNDVFVEKFGPSGTSVASITIASFDSNASGIDIGVLDSAKEVLIVGLHSAAYRAVWIDNTAGWVLGTVISDTTSVATTKRASLRCSCSKDGIGEARIVGYTFLTPSAVAVDAGRQPIIELFRIHSASTTFTYVGTCPGWVECSLPFYNKVDRKFYMHIANRVQDDAGGYDNVSNSSVVIEIPEATLTKLGPDGETTYIVEPVIVMPSYTCVLYGHDDGAGNSITGTNSFRSDSATIGFGTTSLSLSTSDVCLPYRPCLSGDPSYGLKMAFVIMEACDNRGFFESGTIQDRLGLFTYSVVSATMFEPSHIGITQDSISGGIVYHYDGSQQPFESGFVTCPSVHLQASAAGAIGAGTYSYIAVFKCVDNNGRVAFSRTSRPSTVTLGANTKIPSIQVNYPSVTRFGGTVVVEIYRTAGGTTYYMLTRKEMWNSSALATIEDHGLFNCGEDNVPSATLISGATLHRFPSVQGTALDRYHALCGSCVVQHKDRLFYATGNTVYYSSFAVDKEYWWFNPALSFNVHGGSGPIVALASMDGVLVVFKIDSIFIVDGDGPPESGGNGTEFSPPRKIHTEIGCYDQRSVANIPNGIMYLSTRGIDLLTRNYQVQFVGERISTTTNEFGYYGAAVFNNFYGTYLLPAATNCRVIDPAEEDGFMDIPTPINGVLARSGGDTSLEPCTLVYDVVNDSWTRNIYYEPVDEDVFPWDEEVMVANVQDFFFTPIDGFGGFCACAWSYKIRNETAVGICNDAHFVEYNDEDDGPREIRIMPKVRVVTGWCRHPSSKQERVRVSDVYTAGTWHTAHKLTFKYRQDYNGTRDFDDISKTFTIKTFGDTDGFIGSGKGTTPYQRVGQPDKESVQAIQFIIETDTPETDDQRAVGSYYDSQMELFGLTVRLGIKGGGPKNPATQKG